MIDQWTHHQREVNGFRMHYVSAGSGYPIVLLHGFPESWYQWRHIIPPLAERFTVIAPDLRGLGDSQKPMTGYDKRTMATDIHELVRQLGFDRVGVIAQDFGAVVAFYLAYDNRELVERMFILDAAPVAGLVAGEDDAALNMALKLHHVFFHGGNPEMAEKLVSQNVDLYLRQFFTGLDYNYSPRTFSEEVIAEYVRVYSLPGSLRAGFQGYAAMLREDIADLRSATDKLTIPMLAYGADHFLGDITTYWKTVAEDVEGGSVEQCGHFISEEKPKFVIDASLKFFEPLRA